MEAIIYLFAALIAFSVFSAIVAALARFVIGAVKFAAVLVICMAFKGCASLSQAFTGPAQRALQVEFR